MSESMGGIIPECPGDFVGIRKHPSEKAVCASAACHSLSQLLNAGSPPEATSHAELKMKEAAN
jgi:hypothetical protein